MYIPPTKIEVNGIELTFDCFGNSADSAMILINGHSEQLVYWDRDFCRELAALGLFVIRFDNRDSGHSTHFKGVPKIVDVLQALIAGQAPAIPYTLDDMAADVIGLMDALELETAHIFGYSMGAMIGQIVSIRYPERVDTLISAMGTTGERGLPPAQQAVRDILFAPPPLTEAAFHERTAVTWRLLNGATFAYDEVAGRRLSAEMYARGVDHSSYGRQLAAVVAAADRTPALRQLKIPTLVLHGSADPLVPVAAAVATANAIPNAELLIIEGLGHILHRGAWPQIIATIKMIIT